MSATVKTSTVRVVRFAADDGPRYGILEGDAIRALEGDLFGEFRQGEVLREARDARLLAPVEPSKVVLVGYNYLGHAEELKKLQPEDPLVFLKAPSALIGSGADVIYPRDAQNVSYEAELVVVLGRRCSKVSPALD
jgi:2-keto-4-pentenoate hydratase/2-oxohepta-3-ene-1,7-dioic acid hydratase in catechol pathway